VVVGGAPQYITSWDNVGGSPERAIPVVDDAAVAAAGTTSGRFRHLRQFPMDGARFQGGKSNEAYIVAGGAPIYVTSWDNVGGAPTLALPKVDDAVINAAGTASGRYGHLRKLPADGTFVQGAVSHEAYVIAGGAPIYITNWDRVGGAPTTPIAAVDDAALNTSGAASGRYSHVNPQPADGTFVVGTSGQVYRIQGGAPIYVSTWSVFTAEEKALPVTKVDQAVLDSANASDHRYKHLSMLPADGTKLLGSSGKRYVVNAGKPLSYSGSEAFPPTAKVDQYAIDNAGGTGPLAHLLAP
jgi:hypothetical protein